MTDSKAPALFARPGFDLAVLDRDAEAAEWLDRGDFFGAAERALVAFDEVAAKAAAIASDPDLTPDGRQKRLDPLLSAAEQKVADKLAAEVAKIETDLARAQADLDGSARPPLANTMEAFTFEIRATDARRQIEALPVHERAAILFRAADAGDAIVLSACERSYIPLVPPEALAEARRRLGAALNKPAAQAVEAGRKKLALAERVAAIAKATAAQKSRGLAAPKAVHS